MLSGIITPKRAADASTMSEMTKGLKKTGCKKSKNRRDGTGRREGKKGEEERTGTEGDKGREGSRAPLLRDYFQSR